MNRTMGRALATLAIGLFTLVIVDLVYPGWRGQGLALVVALTLAIAPRPGGRPRDRRSLHAERKACASCGRMVHEQARMCAGCGYTFPVTFVLVPANASSGFDA